MYKIKISEEQLNRLRMKADWQLRELGIDPVSVTIACQQLDDSKNK